MLKILECSSKGDNRFSAFFAKVEVSGKLNSIENHYQKSKIFINNKGVVEYPKSWKDVKGKDIIGFQVNGKFFEPKFISAFYDLLWVKYLIKNKDLLEYAKQFDKFNDKFKGKSKNCQADTISNIVKNGVKSILHRPDVIEFSKLLNGKHMVSYINGNLLFSEKNIIAQQVNCKGKMGKGLALEIRKLFPNIVTTYENYCEKNQNILGTCLICNKEGQSVDLELPIVRGLNEPVLIANLFGQYLYGTGRQYTVYNELEKSLVILKNFAKKNALSIGLPYELGCGLAGGDWKEVSSRIEKVFNDYPVTVYKYKK